MQALNLSAPQSAVEPPPARAGREPLIEVRSLSKRFGALLAVDGVSFTVQRGEVLGFLGPNGAGKSTTMKVLTGYLPATSGAAVICGIDVARDPLGAKRRIGYLPEGSPLYGDMTPKSLLAFVAAVRGLRGEEKRRRIAWAVERTALAEVLHRRIETLSKGFRRRVGIAQAILHDPEVLVLDEPTDGLDPNQKHGVRELIRELGRDKAIIISTHILEEVDAVCDRAIVINRGRLVGEGTPEALHARAREHNAVRIRVAGSDAEAVAALCRDSPFVGAVEISEKGGDAWVLATSREGAFIADRIGAALRQARVPVVEMHSEVGRLDDVFRAMTLGQARADGG